MARIRSSDSLETRILSRMKSGEDGAVYASMQFLNLGTRSGVDKALSRLCRTAETA